MLLKYVAFAEAFVTFISVPLVILAASVEDVVTYHVLVSAKVTEVRLEQPENAELPMLVTPSPMVTEVRLVQ